MTTIQTLQHEAEEKINDDIRKAEEEIRKEDLKQQAEDKNLMALITERVSKKWNEDILEYLNDGDIDWHPIAIVGFDKVQGEKQEEPFIFKYVYLKQFTGYLGDDYSGFIYIPLGKDKMYLEVSYSC